MNGDTGPATVPTWERLVRDSGLPRLEAQMLAEIASGHRREWLIAHGDENADAASVNAFTALAQRRHAGEPMAYLVGVREFAGRPFRVTPAVLIPRPETEMLLDFALKHALPGGTVIDLGTGSGVLAVSMACARPDLHITATDCSEAALELARRNAANLCPNTAHGERLCWQQGHWWDAVADDAHFDLILSNPPYVADDDPHLNEGDLRHEPKMALMAGDDGLTALRAIIGRSTHHAASGARIALEHGHDQGEAVRGLLAAQGWRHIATHRDPSGHERLTCAGPFR